MAPGAEITTPGRNVFPLQMEKRPVSGISYGAGNQDPE